MSTRAEKEGFKGYSLLFYPIPEDKARYPALGYLRGIETELVPYDTMHLFLCNLVSHLRELLAGEKNNLGSKQPWVIPKSVCEAVGRVIKAGRRTVPLSQARSLETSPNTRGPTKRSIGYTSCQVSVNSF